MVKIIEARAILTGSDETGGAFKGIIDKINAVAKAHAAMAKSGAKDVMALQLGLEKLNSKAGAISGFRAQQTAMIAARQQYRAAQEEVVRLGRAMKEATAPSREMTREYERSQRVVKQAAATFQEKVSAVKAARSEMASYGVTLRNINAQQAVVERQIGRRVPRGSVPGTGPGARPVTAIGADPYGASVRPPRPQRVQEKEGPGIGEAVAGGGVVKVAKDALMSGANVDTERSQMRQAGWTDAEIKTAEHRANRFAVEWGTSPASAMNIIREARPTFGGDLAQTLKSVPDFFALRTAMRQKAPNASDKDIDNQIGQMIKAGEILGYSQDPERLKQYINFATQMQQIFGSQLRSEEWLNYAKSGKTAAGSFEFDFMRSVLPTMLSEQGGDRLGTALQTMRGAYVGGRMKHAAVKNLAALGLVDEKDGVHRVPKTGEIKGLKPGGIKGAELLSRNPFQWYNELVRPALDAKFGNDPTARKIALSGIASDRNVEYMLHMFEDNHQRMLKDRKSVEQAKGIEGAKEALKDDPFLAANRVKGALENTGAAVAEPFMEPLKKSADAAADALNSLAGTARENPTATGAGTATGATLGALGAYLASKGSSLLWRLPMIAGGAAAGGAAGALGLPLLVSEFLNSDPKLAARARVFGSIPAEDWEASRRRQDFVRRDPEAARGEAFSRLPDLSKVTAVVQQPIDVTGKVALDPASKVDVNVSVKVQGQGTVTGQSVTAGGNARGSVGTSTAGSYE